MLGVNVVAVMMLRKAFGMIVVSMFVDDLLHIEEEPMASVVPRSMSMGGVVQIWRSVTGTIALLTHRSVVSSMVVVLEWPSRRDQCERGDGNDREFHSAECLCDDILRD
jgi:hypothetical protein